jgi:hypothetical protein
MRKNNRLHWAALALLLSLGNCAPAVPPAFSAHGFRNKVHGYKIAALSGADASKGVLMPSDWLLDNYYWDHETLTPKSSPGYKTRIEFDLDGDGTIDRKESAFTHDLRWVHARHNGVIWIRSVPVSTRLRHVDLDVLLADYVNEMSGAGYEGVDFAGERTVTEHRYVAKIVRQTPGTLAGREAIDSELEVANSEQLKLDPKARWQRVRLLLARGPIDHYVRPAGAGELRPFPVVIVLGYLNSPDHFAEGQPDFDDLVSRFMIHKRSGFSPAEAAGASDSDADSDSDDDSNAKDAPARPEASAAPAAPATSVAAPSASVSAP